MSLPKINAAQSILNNAVFLFGAGATKEAGCLMSIDMLNDIYRMNLSNPEIEAVDFLVSSLQYHASWKNLKEKKEVGNSNGHQPNIEDLMLLIRRIVNRDSYLPFPITGSWADKINFLETVWRSTSDYQSQVEKRSLFSTLEEKLTARLPEWLCLGRENTTYLAPIIEYLSESDEQSPPINFFTLNYDLVFEKYLNRNNVTLVNTGFAKGVYSGFDQKVGECRINYYKLHGSLNWFKDDQGVIKERFTPSQDPYMIKLRGEFDKEDVLVEDFLKKEQLSPFIIFGHGGKFLSVEPFISLLHCLKDALEQKDIYFVIGYSFFDPYINNLLLEGLSKDPNKLMIVVNPQFEESKLLNELELLKDAKEKDGLVKNKFINHLQRVQKSTYLSDLPSFNLTDIAPSKVKIIPTGTGAFLKKYFGIMENGLGELNEEINSVKEQYNVF